MSSPARTRLQSTAPRWTGGRTGLAGALLAGISLLGACGRESAPLPTVDWREPQAYRFDVPPYARFLESVRICLDPGHGGKRPVENVGPTGLREAAANLAVALFLRDFLVQAGATVVLTRETDRHLALEARARVAATRACHIFLSLHHNAVDDPTVNYTSTWYHGTGAHSLASLDLARHVQTGVSEALRLPTELPCPLLSDYLRYPDTGFGVLRNLTVPGVLCEASFHTNPEEEARLRRPEYLRREAHGYFIGLARYVAGGLPRPKLEVTRSAVRVELDDGLSRRGGWGADRLHRVPSSTIVVRLDGRLATWTYDARTRTVTVPFKQRPKRVELTYQNIFGNHGWPQAWDLGGG